MVKRGRDKSTSTNGADLSAQIRSAVRMCVMAKVRLLPNVSIMRPTGEKE